MGHSRELLGRIAAAVALTWPGAVPAARRMLLGRGVALLLLGLLAGCDRADQHRDGVNRAAEIERAERTAEAPR